MAMRRSLVAGSAAGLVVLVALLAFASHMKASRPRPVQSLRGEPIAASPETNSSGDPPAPVSQRKRRPKPASFPQRLVEFQVSQGTNDAPAGNTGFGGTLAKVVFTDAKLRSLPDPKLPPGCEKLDFYTPSDFEFDVTSEMANGSNNFAAASAATRDKIPPSIRAMDGRFVAIRGFLVPLKMKNDLAAEILLMRNQNMCCFGKVPKINEWITITVVGEGVKPVMDEPVTIAGTLHVGELRENGYLVGIYRMEATKIYWPEDLR